MQLLRIAALAEAITLLILVGIAVPLKHLAGYPQATAVMGPIHGLVFLSFVWVLFREFSAGTVDRRAACRLAIGAFIPFGGFVNERWLRKQ